MKTYISLIVSCLLIASNQLFAQGLTRKTIEAVEKIQINGASDVFISNSNESSISASEDDFRKINYLVENGVLIINTGSSDAIYVAVPKLSSLIVTGSGDIISSDTLRGNELFVSTTGAGDLNLTVDYNKVEALVTGSTDLKLNGKANELTASISGAGDLKAYNMPVNVASILLSGAGDARVNVIETLKGSVSGAGTLYHRGDPKTIDVQVSGMGEVKRTNNLHSSDTTRISFGNKKIIILDNEEEKEIEIGDDVLVDGKLKEDSKPSKPQMPSIWSGFELGVNGYLNSDNSFNMDSVNSNWALNYGKSIAVNFNVWEARARIIRENVILTTGLGAEINNYRFDKNIRMISDTTPTLAVNEANLDYDKTKLVTGYLNVPVYLTFATNPFKNGKRLSISPGITGGWKFTSYNKRVINENGDRNKSRNKDDFNLNPFRVNASVRIGYGSFILFANYALTSLFQKNEGPNLTPFSAGIRIVGFGNS